VSPGDEDDLGRAYDHRLMRRLMGYLRPYRGRVAAAVAVVILDAAAQIAGPWLTMLAIDNGIRHKDLGYLDRVAVLYLAVLLVAFGLGYLQTQIMQRVGQQIMMDLRMAIFRHLQRLPIAFFDRNPVGRLLTRVTHDVDVLNELFTAGVVANIGDHHTQLGNQIVTSSSWAWRSRCCRSSSSSPSASGHGCAARSATSACGWRGSTAS
jgi:ATP-binding cassette subfamily B protein